MKFAQEWPDVFATEDGQLYSYGIRRLHTRIDPKGYERVSLSGQRSAMVHRVIAGAFCRREAGRNFVNHINGIKHDNRAANLEWVTTAENNAHAISSGLVKRRFSHSDILLMRESHAKGCSMATLADRAGITKSYMCGILSGYIYKDAPGPVRPPADEAKNRGEFSNLSKLKESQVVEIRKMLEDGKTGAFIARLFGVSRVTVYNIQSGSTWGWLK